MGDIIATICMGITTIGFIVGMLLLGIWDSKGKSKGKEKIKLMQMTEPSFDDEGEQVVVHVEVVDMTCGVESVGYQAYKQPKAVKYFVIQFKDDEGGLWEIPVVEEMYDGFEKGQTGMLTLIDGELISFDLDA